MKKYGLALLLAIIVAILFIPFTVEKTVSVKDTQANIAAQTTKPDRIARWYVPFNTAADTVLTSNSIAAGNSGLNISLKDPVSTILEPYNSNSKKKMLLEIFTDAQKPGETLAMLSYNSNLFRKITGQPELIQEAEKSLENLKNFIEDPQLRYGYKIGHTLVTDTTFFVKSGTAAPQELQDAVNKTYEELLNFSEQRGGGYNGVRIFNKRLNAEGLYEFSCAISVTGNFSGKPAPPIQLERMPYQKNLLMAEYTGPYKDVDKAYQALKEYAEDNKLTVMAIPFEKWTDGPVTVGGDDLVRLQVFLPVF